jgi:hypothetical protein
MTPPARANTRSALFVTYTGDLQSSDELAAWIAGEPLSYLQASPMVESVDVFVPDTGDLCYFDEGAAPPLIVQIDVKSAATAGKLLSASGFSEVVMRNQAGTALLDAFEVIHCPPSIAATPPPRTAALSFIVRYYRPVASEAKFISAYMAHHPPTMQRFPNIRNIICYTPLALESASGIESSDVFFGNEVVFDDFAALDAALASDVLAELKAGRRALFPACLGTHFAMRREQVYAR